jgi:hypothetical protein
MSKLAAFALLGLAGCLGDIRAIPDLTPERLVLARQQPVLAVRVTADAGGYKVTTTRTMGVPTPKSPLDRDVLVVARDAAGATVASVSFSDVRAIHEVGNVQGKVMQLPHGSYLVTFADPDRIKVLAVDVRSGVNKTKKPVLFEVH